MDERTSLASTMVERPVLIDDLETACVLEPGIEQIANAFLIELLKAQYHRLVECLSSIWAEHWIRKAQRF